jgi:hypothetical protein
VTEDGPIRFAKAEAAGKPRPDRISADSWSQGYRRHLRTGLAGRGNLHHTSWLQHAPSFDENAAKEH